MKYDLSTEQLKAITDILAKYQTIEKAIIFGSCAINTFREASDIDIVIKGKSIDFSTIAKLKYDLKEETYLPFFVDVVEYNTIESDELIEHIDTKGKVFYVKGSKWRGVKLKEIGCNFISGYSFKSKDYSNDGVPLIKIGNIKNKTIQLTGKNTFISSELITLKLEKYRIYNDDILIAMTGQGSAGRVGKVRLQQNTNAILNQRVGKFICDEENINREYLYHILSSDIYQDYLFNTGSGSGQPNISPDLILETEIPYFEYKEQKAIAEVLSSLDDKIYLLHCQNKTLEELAQTLFRQWFIEEVKNGWEVGFFSDLVDISSGKNLKRTFFYDNGKYKVLGANGEIGRTDEWLFDEKIIFTGRAGTLGKIFINDNKAWLSANTLVIKPKKYFYYIYFLLKSFKLENYNVGSTQPLIRKSDLKKIDISLPPKKYILEFEKQSDEIFKKISRNKQQIKTLESMINTLIPKFMCGEVRVNL